jgi:hypothetical protein
VIDVVHKVISDVLDINLNLIHGSSLDAEDHRHGTDRISSGGAAVGIECRFAGP